jgi:diguanylate cyclase (GGDEF)-like protein
MTWKLAAVLEPNAARHKTIAAALTKAGLKVTPARNAHALTREQVVVLGSSPQGSSRGAREVRNKLPHAFVFAAMRTGFKAAWADAVLPLPVSVSDLRVRLGELQARLATLPVARPGDGILDLTTNFYTFAHFKEVLFVEVKRARRYGFPLALAVMGFDPVGGRIDIELQTQLMSGLALSIRRSLRDTDYPVQHSADRVLLLMPHTDLAGSLIVARRICERVARATLQSGDVVIHPTISIGVAAGEPGREYGFSDLLRHAQQGLAAAQEQGGNRVEAFSSTDGPAAAGASARERPLLPPMMPPPTGAAEL